MSCCSTDKSEAKGSCSTEKSECCKDDACGCGPDCKCGPDCGCHAKKCCPVKCCFTVLLGGLLAAMVMYLFEGFWHGTYLASLYDQTKALWRPFADMQALGSQIAIFTVVFGVVLSFIFAKNYEGKGVGEGVRYGFYVGILLGLKQAAAYFYMPISMHLATLWFFGWIIEGVLVGITLALTFLAMTSKKSCCGSKKASCCGDKKEDCCDSKEGKKEACCAK